jgi:peptidoglycan hydrolase CwlO-like protein
MGYLADDVEAMEDLVEDLKKENEELKRDMGSLEDEIETLKVVLAQYNRMENYLREYHHGVVESFEVAERME